MNLGLALHADVFLQWNFLANVSFSLKKREFSLTKWPPQTEIFGDFDALDSDFLWKLNVLTLRKPRGNRYKKGSNRLNFRLRRF